MKFNQAIVMNPPRDVGQKKSTAELHEEARKNYRAAGLRWMLVIGVIGAAVVWDMSRGKR